MPTLRFGKQHLEQELTVDLSINATEREALVTARRGQGVFKERVMQREQRCRITRVDNPAGCVAKMRTRADHPE